MKSRGEITIEQALSHMRANPEQAFVLTFIRATGKARGTEKTVAKCKIGAHFSQQSAVGSPQSAAGGRKKTLMVDTAQLACHDADTGEYLTPLISHIIRFNLKRVIHSSKKPDQKKLYNENELVPNQFSGFK